MTDGTNPRHDSQTLGTQGGIRALLQLEGLALALATCFLYWRSDADWRLFAMLFLAPDLSLLFYLFGARVGAIAYNAVHSTLGPLTLALIAWAMHFPDAVAVSLIWLAHIGLDRALGFGLKYATGFGATHLGIFGRKRT